MKIRVEPFVNGFMTGLKAQMDAADHEFFRAVFKGHVTSKFASAEEKNPAKASHYFRFGASHLNVLLPTWLLNQKSATKTDRFRIATTEDHSFILDTKESIIYDPTSENLHKQIEYSAFWLSSDWRDEARAKFADELQQKRLKIYGLAERAEHLPDFYKEFTAFVMRHRLKARTPALKLGLQPKAVEDSSQIEDLMAIALEELQSRRKVS
jgi:hypothetical protein